MNLAPMPEWLPTRPDGTAVSRQPPSEAGALDIVAVRCGVPRGDGFTAGFCVASDRPPAGLR
jgi:hypothetical protein